MMFGKLNRLIKTAFLAGIVFYILIPNTSLAIPGDVNGINGIELGDVILSLQTAAGIPTANIVLSADADGNGKIAVEEAIFALQYLANIRNIIYTNSMGMHFSLIPAGSFTMGSPLTEPGRFTDEVQHQAILTKPFYMQTTELTQAQWESVMGSNPASYKSCGNDCPVENISWDEIQAFISTLNQKGEGLYRLPTEAEWEYAARAGSETAFPSGDIIHTGETPLDPNLDKIGWYKGNISNTTSPVGQKEGNLWGLYDMHGNVSEWCSDWYGPYPSGTVVSDYTGPETGEYRIIRGGSYYDYAKNCRSATRSSYPPIFKYRILGFRLVMEAY